MWFKSEGNKQCTVSFQMLLTLCTYLDPSVQWSKHVPAEEGKQIESWKVTLSMLIQYYKSRCMPL